MTLYLLPNTLGEEFDADLFPTGLKKVVESLDGLIAENEKEGRRFLKRFRPTLTPIALLNEHNLEIDPLLIPLKKGETWGLISDAGLPCLADPGSHLVMKARKAGIQIKTLAGPSSLIQAIQLSGLYSQSFFFHGYLPHQPEETIRKMQKGMTHVFIETPYRNVKLFETLLKILPDSALLCMAKGLTTPEEGVQTLPIKEWKKQPIPSFHKIPAVFLVQLS